MHVAAGEIAALTMQRDAGMPDMYLLSPFVWRERTYEMLLRAVPRANDPALKIARVHRAESIDGLRFHVAAQPVIAPGPADDDKDGCEDPTVCNTGGSYLVYYTGWNESRKRGQLMLAAGDTLAGLAKIGVAIPWTSERQNPKEATLARASDGTWRLFFEYAAGGRSRIGLAAAPRAAGPWTVTQPLFEARPERWDSWHLSTGPIETTASGDQIMFYNGGTREAKWRIGWIAFDPQFTRVTARCEEPLIVPPAQREEGATDIAFAASSVADGGDFFLYYSIADKDLFRARVRAS